MGKSKWIFTLKNNNVFCFKNKIQVIKDYYNNSIKNRRTNGIKIFEGLATQSVFQWPPASAASGSLLEWTICAKLQTAWVRICIFKKISRWFTCTWKFQRHYSKVWKPVKVLKYIPVWEVHIIKIQITQQENKYYNKMEDSLSLLLHLRRILK